MRKTYSADTKWEESVGYSRAIRVDNIIEVTGTVAVKNGKVVGKGDAYEQTKCICEKIITAVTALGGRREDIVRTRMYVTHIKEWEKIGRAHKEFFGDIKPATSMVEVSALIHHDMLIEIEATAIIEQE